MQGWAREAFDYSLVLQPLRQLALLDASDGLVVVGLTMIARLVDWLNGRDVPVVLAEVEHPDFSSAAIDHETPSDEGAGPTAGADPGR